MKKAFYILFFLSTVILNAQHLSKVYVLSEGGFAPGTAQLSMLNKDINLFSQSVFTPGSLGLYPDGMIYYNNQLLIAEQGSFGGSGRVYILDTLGTVILSTTVGTNPYSLAAAAGKIYITNGPASNVSVLNLNDLSPVKTISVGVYPQEIFTYGGYVFVANISLFGGAEDSTISVINPATDEVVSTINVSKDPSAFAVSNDGKLLVGCSGDNGKIYKIDPATFQRIAVYDIPGYGFSKDIAVERNSSNIYFIAYTGQIIKYNLDNNSASEFISAEPGTNYYYGYGYDPSEKRHYVLDAKTFNVSGSMVVYDSAGTNLTSYETGTAPRRVAFKYYEGSTAVDDNISVNTFVLSQNYPNPFNPSTKINYSVPAGGNVTLTVYNILGKEVAELVSGYKSAGSYTIDFNASSLSGGIYFYTLSTESGSVTKKMTLLK